MTLFVSRHARHVIEIWPGDEKFMDVHGTMKRVITVPQLCAEFKPRMLSEPQRRAAAVVFGMVGYGRELIMLPNSIDLGDDENGAMIGNKGWTPGYSPDTAATAMPRTHDDIILGPAGPVATSGYDPQFNLGSYDTGDCKDAKGKFRHDEASQIDFQSVKARTDAEKLKVWEAVEAELRASSDFGTSFIALDMSTLPVPFPAYLKIKGDDATALEQMAMVADGAGFNYGVLLDYERATQERPNMIAMFEEKYAEQIERGRKQAQVLAGLEVTL